MATITVKYVSGKITIDQQDATKVFKGLRTVYKDNQDAEIEKALFALVKKKNAGVGAAIFAKKSCKVEGVPKDAAKRSGEHEMKVFVDGKEIAKNKVWINKPKTGISIGISGANSSEKAAKILLAKKATIKGLELKYGDGEHAKDLKWSLNGKSGSLPMTTHTKGDGGKNEKAALAFLKKSMKEAGFS